MTTTPPTEIQTVLGRIPASQLGATDAHTHIARTRGPLVDSSKDFLLDDVDLAVAELGRFKAAGGGAVVEMTPAGPGRCPGRLVKASQASGVHIVAATGFVDWALYPGQRLWLEQTAEEVLGALLAAEIIEGMDANNYTCPMIKRHAARAGVIKAVTGYQNITEFQKKMLQVSAIAHHQTGAPISLHTEHGTCVPELVSLLTAAGVAPSAIIVAHTFLNPDSGYQREIAQTGIYLIQDGPGRVKYLPESNTVEQIRRFLDDGFGAQLLLAGDYSKRSYWKAYGGGPGFTDIIERFPARLRREGVPESAIRAMLVDNPARAFAIRKGLTNEETLPTRPR